MATKYLNEGATGFAAADWGGVAIADSDDLIIDKPFGRVTGAGLDQSGLTTGIESLIIRPTATAGTIGGGSAGSLLIDADNSTDAIVSNRGAVTLNIAAAGGSAKVENLDIGPGATVNCTAGLFEDVAMDGGTLNVNATATCTNFYASGGSSVWEYNATAITTAHLSGGTHTIRRKVTTLLVTNGATVIYDPPVGTSHTSTVLEVHGGTLIWMAGAYPTVEGYGGRIDLRQAKEAMTPGGTSFLVLGSVILPSPGNIVSLSNVTRPAFSRAEYPIPLG